MPWRNQNFWESIYSFFVTYSVLICSFFLTIFISVFSTAKKYGKVDWLEAIICGFLTLSIASALSYLRLPSELAIFIGGFIGFKGSLWVESKFNDFYDRKTKDK